MKYELEVLAALTQYKYPNTRLIVDATGISERKVQMVIKSLMSDLGIRIEKKSINHSFYFFIKSWGCFESGSFLKEHLEQIDLVKAKSERLKKNKKSTELVSLADKKAYFDSVKIKNYKESLRLEGISPSSLSLNVDSEQLQETKEALLSFYSKKALMQVDYAR